MWDHLLDEHFKEFKDFMKNLTEPKLEIPDIFVAEDAEYKNVRAVEVKVTPIKDDLISITKANARFREIAQSWTKVYGWTAHKDKNIWHPEATCYDDEPTHIALVTFPQELKKAECEHEPECAQVRDAKIYSTMCKHCGVKLRAKWEAV